MTPSKATANSWAKQCALHAVATLEMGGLGCIPVIKGADWPLLQTPARFQAWQAVHGSLVWQGVFSSYVANTTSDPTSGSPDRVVEAAFIEGFPKAQLDAATTAAGFMVEQVRKFPGQVSIYAAGALTNVALAVRMDSEFASLAKELVIMGGYVDVSGLWRMVGREGGLVGPMGADHTQVMMYQAAGTLDESNINSDINLIADPESART